MLSEVMFSEKPLLKIFAKDQDVVVEKSEASKLLSYK